MQEIFDAIDQYAEAYAKLEQIQRARTLDIPIGDQKTGVIAEFFARIYAKQRFLEAEFKFGSASEHAWDIKIVRAGQPDLKVQVKAVSGHSRTSRISPIHSGWDQLWLMRLDIHLRPHALWVIEAPNVPWSNELVKNCTMPQLEDPISGSAKLRGASNETAQFLAALLAANQEFHRKSTRSE